MGIRGSLSRASGIGNEHTTAGSGSGGLISGAGVPDPSTGSNGQYYLDTTDHRLYGPKASGTWPGTYQDLTGVPGTIAAFSGDLTVADSGAGIILRNGSVYKRLAIDASGTLITQDYTPPLAIPTTNLFAWYKADALSGAVDADAIATWPDSSGNGRDATQTTVGQRPIFKTAIINSKPVLRFAAASSQKLAIPALGSPAAVSAFVIVKATNDPGLGDGSALWRIGTSGSTFYPFSDGVVYDDFASTVRKTAGNPTPSLASFRLYEAVSTATEWTDYIDGTQFFTTATNTVGVHASPLLGSDGSNHLNGDIAEVILYTAKQSSGDRTAVKTYLATKYGLTIA